MVTDSIVRCHGVTVLLHVLYTPRKTKFIIQINKLKLPVDKTFNNESGKGPRN